MDNSDHFAEISHLVNFNGSLYASLLVIVMAQLAFLALSGVLRRDWIDVLTYIDLLERKAQRRKNPGEFTASICGFELKRVLKTEADDTRSNAANR